MREIEEDVGVLYELFCGGVVSFLSSEICEFVVELVFWLDLL